MRTREIRGRMAEIAREKKVISCLSKQREHIKPLLPKATQLGRRRGWICEKYSTWVAARVAGDAADRFRALADCLLVVPALRAAAALPHDP